VQAGSASPRMWVCNGPGKLGRSEQRPYPGCDGLGLGAAGDVPTAMYLERVQERCELVFFLGSQIHLETLVVKFEQLAQILRGAIVKVRRA
jgi:hypothetical protein